MKKKLLLIAFLSVISFSLFAQTWTTSAAQEGNMPTSWVCNFGGGGVWGGDLWLSGTLPANVEFTFTGTQVRIVGIPVNVADFVNDGINSTVDISIDGILIEDNYTGWIQNTSDVGNVLIWTSGTLTVGEHKIKVELNGNEIGINAFEYTAPAASTILDDTDAGWTWTGFAEDPKPECYGGNQHVAEVSGSTAEFEFTGSSIKFYGEKWIGGPSLEIFIYGVSKGTFSQSIAPEGLKNLFATITGLDNVNHSVKLVSIGEWAAIDYVDFTPITILDDKDSAFTWTGFTVDEQPDGYLGQQHVAELTGSTVEFNFTGTNIDFYGETWDGAASFEIFIDNVSKGTFSQSIVPYGLKNLFATITGLENVNHAVKMVSIGEWASLDYVDFTPLPSKILDDTDAGWTWTGFAEDPKPECYGGNQHVSEVSRSTDEF